MNATVESLGIDKLQLEDRLALVQEIWDGIAETEAVALTLEQRDELERRIDADDADPADVLSWDEARAIALANIRR